VFLHATLTSVYVQLLSKLIESVFDRYEEMEKEGQEAMLTVAMLVHRAGGKAKLSWRDYELVKPRWLQRRSCGDGMIEYRLVKGPPKDS